ELLRRLERLLAPLGAEALGGRERLLGVAAELLEARGGLRHRLGLELRQLTEGGLDERHLLAQHLLELGLDVLVHGRFSFSPLNLAIPSPASRRKCCGAAKPSQRRGLRRFFFSSSTSRRSAATSSSVEVGFAAGLVRPALPRIAASGFSAPNAA